MSEINWLFSTILARDLRGFKLVVFVTWYFCCNNEAEKITGKEIRNISKIGNDLFIYLFSFRFEL